MSARRLQQRVAFERLLARLSHDSWLLKDGFALELRYSWTQRPTKDIDLRTEMPLGEAIAMLREEVVRQPAGDPFTFELGTTANEMQGAPGGAIRVPVTTRLAGTIFAQFHLDISSGDAVVGEPDLMVGSDLLAFAGIEPVAFPTYPIAQHLAEKLHAYTLPRDQDNTRVKDLVDIVTLAAMESVDGDRLTESVQATFDARATHEPPDALPRPPARWSNAFAALLAESPGTPMSGLDDGYELAAQFWNPVLARQASGRRWVATVRQWRAEDSPQRLGLSVAAFTTRIQDNGRRARLGARGGQSVRLTLPDEAAGRSRRHERARGEGGGRLVRCRRHVTRQGARRRTVCHGFGSAGD